VDKNDRGLPKVPLIHLPGVPEKIHERQTISYAGRYSNLYCLYPPPTFLDAGK